VMHHGTLLFSTNMQMLANLLYISDDLYSDKAVKSVRAKTTNLNEHLPPEITLEKFREHVIKHMTKKHSSLTLYTLTEEDNAAIYDLVEKKYNTWQWNFGYSPSYKFSRSFTLKGKHATINVEVQKGVLSNVNVKGDSISAFEKGTIESSLTGCNHMEDVIKKHLNGTILTTEMQQKILEALF